MAEMLLVLKFLAGCWLVEQRGMRTLEVWSGPMGALMLGHSQTERAGKTLSYEYLRIEPREGALVYIPTIRGRETIFTSVKATAQEAVFENLAHDFPQRIIYRPTADGLEARIESADSKKGMNYSYKRVACHE